MENSAGNLYLYFTKPFHRGLGNILGAKKNNDNLYFLYIQKWLAYYVYQSLIIWREVTNGVILLLQRICPVVLILKQ